MDDGNMQGCFSMCVIFGALSYSISVVSVNIKKRAWYRFQHVYTRQDSATT